MATRPVGLPKLSRRSKILIGIGIVVLIVLVRGRWVLDTYVDWLWYGEVGFRSVFTTQLWTEVVLFFAAGALVGGLAALAMVIAYRTRPVFVPVSGVDDPLARYRAAITRRPRLVGIGIPVLIGLITGATAVDEWQTVQLFLNGQPFGIQDPQFHIDIGFYAFTLPFILWIKVLLLTGIALSFFTALIAHYIFGGIRLAGRGGQLSVPARAHLAILAGLFVLLKAFAYFFDRYELLYSDRNDKFSGASYTDINALLPAKLILLCIAAFCALAFFAGAFLRNLQLPAIAIVLMLLSSILIGAAFPAIMEQFSVRANAQQKEAPYIARNIAATRQAYGITPNKIDMQPYDPSKGDLSPQAIKSPENTNTVSNIRLLDPNILSPTFTQLTAGNKNFYGFPDKLSIDRYNVGGKTQDYIVAAREINPDKLADSQRDWINQHLVYTHGNGFVAAPANKVNTGDQGGYPDISVSDINNPGQGGLYVKQPRIYFGLLDQDYAIVGGKAGQKPREYDADGRNFTYDGSGGVRVGNWFNKLVFAADFWQGNFLFSSDVSQNSKVLFNRDPRDRVQKVAPWLTVDGDPYPAVVNGQIKWIVDGYTTLDDYPYSESTSLASATTVSNTGGTVRAQADRRIGYIRNSVKATVDAYTGKVDLYSVDDSDPVLKTWEKVFPGTVQPQSKVPPALSAHFRYPEDLFKVQRDLLARYHVTDPQEFYSTQSFWSVPPDPTVRDDGSDPTTAGPSTAALSQPPYYVLAQAPGQKNPEFQLMSTLTPLNRQNMAAWVSASSDPGSYGRFTVLVMPSGTQTPGPFQTQNAFDTSPQFTGDRTLYNNRDVDVQFGNLLTLPVAGGIMYIEPVYIKRNGEDSYPNLAKVLVSFNNQVGVGDDLQKALDALTPGGPAPTGGDQAGLGGSGPSTSPSPSPSAPPTSTAPPSGGTPNPQLAAAVRDIQSALAEIRSAQQRGDFSALGDGYQKLDAATKRFEAASGQTSPASQNTPSTSTNPPNAPG